MSTSVKNQKGELVATKYHSGVSSGLTINLDTDAAHDNWCGMAYCATARKGETIGTLLTRWLKEVNTIKIVGIDV